jgi:uncharacterized membrane protein
MVTSTRNPFEVLLVSAFGIYCAAGLVAFDKVATTVLRAFPEPWARVFLGLALVTCVIVLIGIGRSSVAVGVLLERAGLVGLGAVCAAYTVWAFGNTGVRALGFGLLLGALAASSLLRAWQIARALGAARKG